MQRKKALYHAEMWVKYCFKTSYWNAWIHNDKTTSFNVTLSRRVEVVGALQKLSNLMITGTRYLTEPVENRYMRKVSIQLANCNPFVIWSFSQQKNTLVPLKCRIMNMIDAYHSKIIILAVNVLLLTTTQEEYFYRV